MTDEPVRPDAVEPAEAEPKDESLAEPTKLIRIAAMTRAMLDEVRQAPTDENGRLRLAEVHRQSVDALRDSLSDELLDEFDQVMVPLQEENVSEAEIRVAQAQLIGWLEGVFHGIQASLFSQQVAAQSQLAQMQRRRLQPPQPGQGPPTREENAGLYL